MSERQWYPSYHLAAPSGWINDPNGLIYFKGHYHAFYQHNPNDTTWGPMHWGHARSLDMVDWEHLPIALAPSPDLDDRGGCFSGSAIVIDDKLHLIYTGHSVTDEACPAECYKQVQMMASSDDGVTFTKKGTILEPPDNQMRNFRDPKVFKDDRNNETWFMVLGTSKDSKGETLLFKTTSNDLKSWTLDMTLAKGIEGQGYMWECPDFFPLRDRKYALVVSPQGIKPNGYNYRNLYHTAYFVGNWAPGSDFIRDSNEFTELDHGHDFYATQSFLAPDGRRIMVAWIDMWERPFPETKEGWSGMLSLPREITLGTDNKIRQNPVREIASLRKNSSLIEKKTLHNEFLVLEKNVTAIEMSITWSSKDGESNNAEKFGLRLGDNDYSEEASTLLYFDTQSNRLILDRRYPKEGLSGYRSVSLTNCSHFSLRVFFDHSSIEAFVENGVSTMSSRIYPKSNQRVLTLFAENGYAFLEKAEWWIL